MEPNPIKIFISYRRSDSPGHAGRLSDAFRNKYGREQIFKDVTSIRGGVHFPSVIKKAIEDASVMVVAIGPMWTGKRLFKKARVFDEIDWIRQEIETALNTGTHILPVLINGGIMPDKSELPVSLHFFADLNAVTVRDYKWEEDIEDVYSEIEQLVKLPPLTTVSKSIERKDTKNRFSSLVPTGLFLLAVVVIAYLIYKPKPEIKPILDSKQSVKPQIITSDWRSKIAMVTPKSNTGAKATGFFVSNDGHLLTLMSNYEKDSVFNILTADNKTYEAHKLLRIDLNDFSLALLKSPLHNTSFIQLTSRARVPEENLSIEISGVEGGESKWKRYTARVSSYDSGNVYYDRPEKTWSGIMGAPIVDVSDETAFGVHIGFASADKGIKRKVAKGFRFTQGQIDSIDSHLNEMKK